MIDLTKTIAAKSDQLNSDDLIASPITVKITKVSAGSSEQPIVVNYDGDGGKPWYPCKSMRRLLVMVWGADGLSYVGRSLTLFRDPEVKWGGIAVGGIRVSHMSNLDKTLTIALTATRGNKKPFTVKPLKQGQPSNVERAPLTAPLHELQDTAGPTLETDADVLRVAMREAAAIGEKEFIAIWLGMTADEKITMNDYKNELKQQLTEGK